jgi:hypothetical protein
LTTRLWDAYLPAWRSDSTNITEVPQDIKDGLQELLRHFRQAKPASNAQGPSLDELDFAEVSRQIKPLKGDYFRIAKGVALKSYQEELKKEPQLHPVGTHFAALLESLERICADPRYANVEVVFISFKLDEHGERIAHGDKNAAEIRSVGIHELGEETRGVLKIEYDKYPPISIMILWTLYGAGKLGILKFQPVEEDKPIPAKASYEDWEGEAMIAYLDRHKL